MRSDKWAPLSGSRATSISLSRSMSRRRNRCPDCSMTPRPRTGSAHDARTEIAEPILRPDEFSNDGADHCQSHGDFQSDNNESHRRRDSNLDERRIDNRLCQRNADRNRQCEALQSDMKHCKFTWRTGLIFSNIEFMADFVYQIILCGRALPEKRRSRCLEGRKLFVALPRAR